MIIISCDHGGYEYANKLQKYFDEKNMKYKYIGPTALNPDDDYPDFALPASEEVLKKKSNIGIFFCGSGIGVSMVANRLKGIRAVNANTTRLAFLARKDEDANVLCLGARLLSFRKALKIINTFLSSNFEGGRHLRRLNKY